MLKEKCSNCGYVFTSEDGEICPECLTSREGFRKSESLSEDISRHMERESTNSRSDFSRADEKPDKNTFFGVNPVGSEYIKQMKNSTREERAKQITQLFAGFTHDSSGKNADNSKRLGKIIKAIFIFIILVNIVPILIAFLKVIFEVI